MLRGTARLSKCYTALRTEYLHISVPLDSGFAATTGRSSKQRQNKSRPPRRAAAYVFDSLSPAHARAAYACVNACGALSLGRCVVRRPTGARDHHSAHHQRRCVSSPRCPALLPAYARASRRVCALCGHVSAQDSLQALTRFAWRCFVGGSIACVAGLRWVLRDVDGVPTSVLAWPWEAEAWGIPPAQPQQPAASGEAASSDAAVQADGEPPAPQAVALKED